MISTEQSITLLESPFCGVFLRRALDREGCPWRDFFEVESLLVGSRWEVWVVLDFFSVPSIGDSPKEMLTASVFDVVSWSGVLKSSFPLTTLTFFFGVVLTDLSLVFGVSWFAILMSGDCPKLADLILVDDSMPDKFWLFCSLITGLTPFIQMERSRVAG